MSSSAAVLPAAHTPPPSLDEFLRFLRKLGISSGRGWQDYLNGAHPSYPIAIAPTSPFFIRHPESFFAADWPGWVKATTRPFEEARTFARSLHLKGWDDWERYTKGELKDLPPLPCDIPKTPSIAIAYRGQWSGMQDWLGYQPEKRDFLDFAGARAFVHKLKLKTKWQWADYVAGKRKYLLPLPTNIPRDPSGYYDGKGWVSWNDFLGSTTSRVRFGMPFAKARAFAMGLRLTCWQDWLDWVNDRRPDLPPRPFDMPKAPQVYYADNGWQGSSHFLGLEGEADCSAERAGTVATV